MEPNKTNQASKRSADSDSGSSQPRGTKRPKLNKDPTRSTRDGVNDLESNVTACDIDAEGDGQSNETGEEEISDECGSGGGGDEFRDDDEEQLDILNDDSEDYDLEDYEEEDEDARDYDIEELDYTISGDPERVIKIRGCVCRELDIGHWLENILVRCTLDGNIVATAVGRYIHRNMITANFWRDMEEPSQDMANLAFELFDRHGYLQPKFQTHCVQRGTGAWGDELNTGPLFFIEDILIKDKDLRRKGLGRAMVDLLMKKAQAKEEPRKAARKEMGKDEILNQGDILKYRTLHTIVIPGWLRADVDSNTAGKSKAEQRQNYNHIIDSATAFYRKLGFRRIGASNCFGYSFDPAHKSRAIELDADFDPCYAKEDNLSDEDDDEESFSSFLIEKKEKKRLERLRKSSPLHHATITMSDMECVEFYQAFSNNDSSAWQHVNHQQNNILHVAACQQKPESIKWLLENVDTEGILSSGRNMQGYTPLEALQDLLEVGRTRREVGMSTLNVSDRFEGFAQEAVESISLLMGLNLHAMPSIARQRLTFGCTCGDCLEGFMSPRMKAALLFQAEVTNDMLDMSIESGTEWCEWHDDTLEYVEPDLRQNFRTNKSYRQGFTNIFSLIAESLKSNAIPTIQNVLLQYETISEWPPVTKNYLNRRGSLESKIHPALEACFRQAEEQGEKTGNGEYETTMKSEVLKLKKCRNDDEFWFVAVQCGLPAREYL